MGGGVGARGLGGGKGAQGDQNGRINGSGIVKEGPYDLLQAFKAHGVKWSRGISGCSELGFGAIVWWCPGVW